MGTELLQFQTDLSKAISDLSRLGKSLSSVNKALEAFIKTANQSSNNNLNSAFGELNRSVSQLNSNLDASQRKLQNIARGRVKQLLPKPDPRDLNAVVKYTETMERIDTLMKQIDPSNLQNVLDAYSRGFRIDPSKVTAPVRELIRVLDQFRNTANKIDNPGALMSSITRSLGPKIQGGSVSAQRALADAKSNLLELAKQSGLTRNKIVEINNNLGASYTGTARVIANALTRVHKAYEQLAKSAQRSANAERQALEASRRQAQASRLGATLTSSISGDFNPRQLQAINAQITRITNLVNKGKLSVQEFGRVFNAIARGEIRNFTQAEQQAAAALTRMAVAAAQAGGSVRGLQSVVARAADTQRRANSRFQDFSRLVTGIFVGNTLFASISRIRQEIVDSIQTAADLSTKIAEIQTISGRELPDDVLRNRLRQISEQFPQDIFEVAEAQYEALSNQVGNTEESLQFLVNAGNFARAAVTKLSVAVNLGTAAMNAFHLGVDQADKIFASFFKTIDLGRIRAEEISNTFGRVAAISSAMGASLDEVNAALATISIRGVPAEEAMTQLVNLFTQLSRPTKAMTELLAEYNEESAQSFIENRGLIALLKVLSDRIGGTVQGAREFSREIRATNAILNLTGNNLQTVIDYFNQISNAQNDAAEAAASVSQTLGDRYKRLMDQLKNFFSIDIGERVLRVIVNVGEALGGFTDIVRVATFALIGWVSAISIHKIVSFTASIKTLNILFLGMPALLNNMTKATLAWSAALLSAQKALLALVSLPAAVGAAVGAAIGAIIHYTTQATGEIERLYNATVNSALEAKRIIEQSNREQSTIFKQEVKTRKDAMIDELAAIGVVNNQILTTLNETAKTQSNNLKQVFGTFSSFASNEIQAVDRQINKINSEISTGITSLNRREIDRATEAFDRQRKIAEAAGDTRRLKLIDKQEIDLLSKVGTKFYNTGEIKAANDAFEQINRTLQEQFNRQLAINKELKLGPRHGIAAIEREILKYRNLQYRLQAQAVESQERELEILKQKKVEQQKALETFHKSTRELINLSTGDLLKFETPEKARAELEKLINDVTSSVKLFDPNEQLGVIKQVLDFEKTIRQRIHSEFVGQAIQDNKKFINETLTELVEAEAKARQISTQAQRELIDVRKQANLIFEQFDRYLEQAGEGSVLRFRHGFGHRVSVKSTPEFAEAQRLMQELRSGVREGTLTREQLLASGQRIEEILQRFGVQTEQTFANIQIEKLNRAENLLFIIDGILGNIQDKLNQISTDKKLTDLFDKELTAQELTTLQQLYDQAAAKITQTRITPTIDNTQLRQGVNETIFELNRLLTAIQEARSQSGGAGGFQFGGMIPRYATGGIVGRDSVLAALSPNEFVVNEKQSQKHFALLTALNANRVPRIGGNSTTIGDITVNVHSDSKSPEITGRKIGNALLREIRKGTIRNV